MIENPQSTIIAGLLALVTGGGLVKLLQWWSGEKKSVADGWQGYATTLEDRVTKLEERVDSTSAAKEATDRENEMLRRYLSEILIKVSALLHKLTNMEGYKTIKEDVEELEREFRSEKFKL